MSPSIMALSVFNALEEIGRLWRYRQWAAKWNAR